MPDNYLCVINHVGPSVTRAGLGQVCGNFGGDQLAKAWGAQGAARYGPTDLHPAMPDAYGRARHFGCRLLHPELHW